MPNADDLHAAFLEAYARQDTAGATAALAALRAYADQLEARASADVLAEARTGVAQFESFLRSEWRFSEDPVAYWSESYENLRAQRLARMEQSDEDREWLRWWRRECRRRQEMEARACGEMPPPGGTDMQE